MLPNHFWEEGFNIFNFKKNDSIKGEVVVVKTFYLLGSGNNRLKIKDIFYHFPLKMISQKLAIT